MHHEPPETLTTYRARNIVTIPAEVANDLQLRVGENFIVSWDKSSGTITLTKAKVIPAEDAWYYTPETQAAMSESFADAAAGRVTRFESDEEFLAALEE
jgi:hypothetical protein